jgi:hypothetical protein
MIDNEDIQEQSIDTSLNNIFGNVLNGINTCMPGYILSYDNSTQLAKVQPIFKTSFLKFSNDRCVASRTSLT